MKAQDNDKELRKLIREIKLESPGNEFTMKVMNRVFEEKMAIEKVEKARILGPGFWVIVSLFAALIVISFVTSNTGSGEQGFFSKLLEGVNTSGVSKEYQSVFSKLGSLPLSIGGILIASSILVFIDKFLPNIFSGLHLKKA